MGGQDEANSCFSQMLCAKYLKTTQGLCGCACWAQSETQANYVEDRRLFASRHYYVPVITVLVFRTCN